MELDDGTGLGGPNPQMMPAEDDRRLMRSLLSALDWLHTDSDVEKGALVLHQARRQREKELRNHLKKLGGQAEARKYQLIMLNKAHANLKARHHRKHRDCEILKGAMYAANFTQAQIIAMLNGDPPNNTGLTRGEGDA